MASKAERDALYSSKGISTQDPGKCTTHLTTIKVGRWCDVAGKYTIDLLIIKVGWGVLWSLRLTGIPSTAS